MSINARYRIFPFRNGYGLCIDGDEIMSFPTLNQVFDEIRSDDFNERELQKELDREQKERQKASP